MNVMTVPDHELTLQPAERLQAALETRTARVCVIGLGYVGLPMAVAFAGAGFAVVGMDVNPERCEALINGRSYIEDLKEDELHAALESGRLSATTDPSLLGDADVILICVPTPLRNSRDPDLSAILAAGQAVAANLRPGQLIVLESTTYPGTTEEILLPMFEARDMLAGKDFFLAFSPERIDPGNAHFSVQNIGKLVGGVTPVCTCMATLLYEQVVQKVVPVTSTRVAEAAKLLENTFRSVNIALANEMAIVCRHLGVDVWEVIAAAATKPFGFMAHYPGPGIGGHCIPLDPHYLSWKARLNGYEPRFISLASDINGGMPSYVVKMVAEALNDHGQCIRGSRIHLMGVAYKPNIGDYRESPALEILDLLQQRGARLSYSDPFVESVGVGSMLLTNRPLDSELLHEVNCVLIVTNHSDFNYDLVVREASIVVDTRNATRSYGGKGSVYYL